MKKILLFIILAFSVFGYSQGGKPDRFRNGLYLVPQTVEPTNPYISQIYYKKPLNKYFYFDGINWIEFSSSSTPILPDYADIFSDNAIIEGGIVHLENLTYNVWVKKFIINGNTYEENISQDITLNAADAALNRFDVFYVEKLSDATPATLGVLEGVLNSSPVKPTVNQLYQTEISFKLVQANETTDVDAVTSLIYDEGVEWTINSAAAGYDTADVSTAYKNTTSIQVPANQSGIIEFQNTSHISYLPTGSFVFAIKLNAVYPKGGSIGGGSPTASIIKATINNTPQTTTTTVWLTSDILEASGLDVNNITTWQLIQVPQELFNFGALQFDTFTLEFVNNPSLNIDFIEFQGGVNTPYIPEPIPTKTSDIANDGVDGTSRYLEVDEAYNNFIIVNTSTGNDATAEIGNKSKPYATLAEAIEDLYVFDPTRMGDYTIFLDNDSTHYLTEANLLQGGVDLNINAGDNTVSIIQSRFITSSNHFKLRGSNLTWDVHPDASTTTLTTGGSMLLISDGATFDVDIDKMYFNQTSIGISIARGLRFSGTGISIKKFNLNTLTKQSGTFANYEIVIETSEPYLMNVNNVQDCVIQGGSTGLTSYSSRFSEINIGALTYTGTSTLICHTYAPLKIKDIICTSTGEVDLFFDAGVILLGGTLENTHLIGQGFNQVSNGNYLTGLATITWNKNYSYLYELNKFSGIPDNTIETNIFKNLHLTITSDNQSRCTISLFSNEDTDYPTQTLYFDNTTIIFDQTNVDVFRTGGTTSAFALGGASGWSRTGTEHGIVFKNSFKVEGGRYLFNWVGDLDYTTADYLVSQNSYIQHIGGTGISSLGDLKIHLDNKSTYFDTVAVGTDDQNADEVTVSPAVNSDTNVQSVLEAQQISIDAKQSTLVSGTNIKTVNGNSLLGSGDITISGGGSSGGFAANTGYEELIATGGETSWVLSATPVNSTNNQFFIGSGTGVGVLVDDTHYSLSGNTLTLSGDAIPLAGERLKFFYAISTTAIVVGTSVSTAVPSQIIDLNNQGGAVHYTPEYNAVYTTANVLARGWRKIAIDTTGETVFPTITGATLRPGADFATNEIFDMIVGNDDGANVYYYFLAR